mgnify:CR=1 FL=1
MDQFLNDKLVSNTLISLDRIIEFYALDKMPFNDDQIMNLAKSIQEEENNKLLVWAVSSTCSWNSMFGQWALLAYILQQILTRFKSPNRDSKSPNKDSYVLNVVIDS